MRYWVDNLCLSYQILPYMRVYLFIVLTALCCVFLSCESHEDDHDHTTQTIPNIQILSPQENSEFKSSDSVLIEVVFSNEGDLHYAEIIVEQLNSGALQFKKEHHTHDKNYHYKGKFVYETDSILDLKLIALTKEHSGKENKRVTRNFTVKP